MSKGKKYNIPRKYLHKYPIRKWNRCRYKIIGGKNGEKKAKFKFFSGIRSFGSPWRVMYL